MREDDDEHFEIDGLLVAIAEDVNRSCPELASLFKGLLRHQRLPYWEVMNVSTATVGISIERGRLRVWRGGRNAHVYDATLLDLDDPDDFTERVARALLELMGVIDEVTNDRLTSWGS